LGRLELYDVLTPHVTKIVVCNPRKNALLKEGSKRDKIDARKLAELLRVGLLRPLYHGENGIRTLKLSGALDESLFHLGEQAKQVYSWCRLKSKKEFPAQFFASKICLQFVTYSLNNIEDWSDFEYFRALRKQDRHMACLRLFACHRYLSW